MLVNISMSTVIIPPAQPPLKTKKHVLWTVYTFLGLCSFIMGLLIWQLWGLTPNNWCFVAKAGVPADSANCFNSLLHLLDIKDHIVIGLMGIMGIIVIALAVVVLKVFVKVDAPGGISVNVGGSGGEVHSLMDDSSEATVTTTTTTTTE